MIMLELMLYQARRKQLQIGGGGAHINFLGAHIKFFLGGHT